VGFARREASLDAPVGFDAYSYGIRDVAGQKVHMSRPKDFFPPGEDIKEGDVIGLEIQLPSERLQRKIVTGQYNPAVDLADEETEQAPDQAPEAPNIIRDRIPIRFKAHIYFEKIDYHSTKEMEDLMNPSPMAAGQSSEEPNSYHQVPALRTLPRSCINVYKNGVLMGTPWTDLLAFLPPASKQAQQTGGREALDDGTLGYYPAVSVFRGGAVEVNFGPDFWYPPPAEDAEMTEADGPQKPKSNRLRAVSERYDEQIVEDIVYDIIDEVGFWMQDGQKVIDRSARDEKAEAVAQGSNEIKELVQDD
jgi:COMPASS component BRE2